MSRRPRSFPLALVACLALSHVAWAKPKVALTAIDGDASGDVHDAVAEALEGGKEVALVGNREVTRAVDKIGDVADLTEKDFKKLSSELEADAIIVGKLEKSGGAKSLKLKIFAHKKMAKGFTVSFKDAKSAKFQAVLHDKILDKIGVAPGSGGDDAEAEADAKPTKKGKKVAAADDAEEPASKKGKKGKKAKAAAAEEADADAEAEAKPKKFAKGDKLAGGDATDDAEAKPTKKKPAAEDADAEAGARGDEDAPKKKKVAAASADEEGGDAEASVSARAERPAGERSTATPAVRLDLGPSILQHTYKFTGGTGTPQGSKLAATPGVRLGGEIYPFAFSDSKSALSGFGLGGDVDHTLTLKLTAKNGDVMQQTTVKQMNYSIGLRYRLAFGGGTDTSPTVTFGFGYGKRLFSPDKAKLMDAGLKDTITRNTPTTEYTLVDPGVAFRYPFTAKIAASLGVRGLIITNGGPIQAPTSYGAAKVYGVEADLGVDILFTHRIGVRLSGDIDQIGFTFQGTGALSKGPDGNKLVTGLADRGIGGAATLAVLY